MRKKKIAFVVTRFVVGGVEKSFLDLMENIDQSLYDITVYLPDDQGEWTSILQEKCDVRYLRIEDFKTVIAMQLREMNLYGVFRSLFYRILARYTYERNYRKSTEYFIRSMRREKDIFDCVVAYQIINDDCVLGSLHRIKGRKKAVWSHAYINKQESIYENWYNKFDKIFCVSNYAKNAFVINFPALKNKTEILHNTINSERIKRMAQEPIEVLRKDDEVIIVTVGRLSVEKGQVIIPKIARTLIDLGFHIKWYLIGDGEQRKYILQEIERENLTDTVILLGNKSNPYPYMAECDIYVQTSLTEGWGLTVTEAKVLNKIIITTDAGVMAEQIQNGINGIVVSTFSPNDIAKEIKKVIENPKIGEEFVRRLQVEDVAYAKEIKKLYDFIEAGE